MTTNEIKKKKPKVFTLRISEKLFLKIQALATDNKRSISKQIEFMLEKQV